MSTTKSPYLVSGREMYREIRQRLAQVFDAEKRFPEQVFHWGYSHFKFVEFDLMLSPPFWNVLAALGRVSDDHYIFVTVLDPDPEAYFDANFSSYGTVRLPRAASERDYSVALSAEPVGSPADAIMYVSSVIGWMGDSGRWAFWGERSLGIGVLGLKDPVMPATNEALSCQSIHWFSADEAIGNLVALNFAGHAVPPDLATTLRAKYPA